MHETRFDTRMEIVYVVKLQLKEIILDIVIWSDLSFEMFYNVINVDCYLLSTTVINLIDYILT